MNLKETKKNFSKALAVVASKDKKVRPCAWSVLFLEINGNIDV